MPFFGTLIQLTNNKKQQMKKLIRLSAMLLLFAAIFSSCKKDEEPDPIDYNLNTEYFTVKDAAYVQDEFPEASGGSAPSIETINGNPSVIPGGSNPIAIQTNDDITKILVGVSDVGGYFSLPASAAKDTGDFLFYILMNQTLAVETFNIIIAIQAADGTVSVHEIIAVSLVQVGTGKLQVSCAWDQLNDVDLHLVEPNGEEIYYGNGTSANGGELDLDSNAACGIDYVNNENITYIEDAIVENGEYIVRVDFWANCDITENTNYSVTAYHEGVLLTPTTGTNPYQGSFTPTEEDAGGVGSGVEVMKFSISGAKSNIETQSLLKFNYPSNKRVIKNLSPQKGNM